jgi:hypothetical protein
MVKKENYAKYSKVISVLNVTGFRFSSGSETKAYF